MPPNISDTFIIMKPKSEWPDKGLSKADLVAKVETVLESIPGGAFEITQPIQMRFNELIAGARGDVAIKVLGDDFDRSEEHTTELQSRMHNSYPVFCLKKK